MTREEILEQIDRGDDGFPHMPEIAALVEEGVIERVPGTEELRYRRVTNKDES